MFKKNVFKADKTNKKTKQALNVLQIHSLVYNLFEAYYLQHSIQ